MSASFDENSDSMAEPDGWGTWTGGYDLIGQVQTVFERASFVLKKHIRNTYGLFFHVFVYKQQDV